MSEQAGLVKAITTISTKYLPTVVLKKDQAGILKWSLRLADYATRLAVIVSPPLAKKEFVALAPEVEAPPNFGESKAMSTGLYNDWVSAWFQKTFPEAYRDWPPTVHAVDPSAIAIEATQQGCLAQVCAAGTLGYPGGPWDAMGDWSLYTALVGTTDEGGFVYKVFHMGKFVGETKSNSPDSGLDFAKSLGFDW